MKDIINLTTLYPNYFIFSLSFLSVLFLTFLLKISFLNIGFVDRPNKRSNHSSPVALGGGIAIISIIATFSFFMVPGWHTLNTIILLLLFSISVIDDFLNVNILTRLFTHLICAFLYVNIYLENFFLDFLSSNIFLLKVIVYILSILSLAWFINIFNFMDGIDGITAVETISIGMGLFLIILICGGRSEVGLSGLVLAASALGFMWWNWSPSQLFLGDVGSIPLGFIIGWLLLQILPTPLWLISVIIPLYYLSDATITLIIRCLNREKFWLPHRKHFYQLATSRGLSHAHIASTILILNVCLIGWAWLSLEFPYISIFCASLCVLLTLFYFRGVK